jgi:hypothetical protein
MSIPDEVLAHRERFWCNVMIGSDDECWLWQRCTDQREYGFFGFGRKQYRAHRIAWILTYGAIPEGLLICHHCDNPPCVNPKHLFLGTSLDNNHDRDRKGRFRPLRGSLNGNTPQTAARGEATGGSKLIVEQVLEIRRRHRNGNTAKSLAPLFGVSERAIGQIVHRETWTHI